MSKEFYMSKGAFDVGSFYRALDSERSERGISWKKLSDETGLSPSTLTRMGQGRTPDVEGLLSLANWAGLSVQHYYVSNAEVGQKQQTIEEVKALLRADASLSDEDATLLDILVTTAYNQMKNR